MMERGEVVHSGEDCSLEAGLSRMDAAVVGADRAIEAADAYVYVALGSLVVMLAVAVLFAGIG